MNDLIEEPPSNQLEPPPEDQTENGEELVQPISPPTRRSLTILRNILRWTLILLISFGLGLLTLYFVSLTPAKNELEQTKADLTEAAQTIESLEEQRDQIHQINQELESQLETAELRLMMLSVISDVRAANLATQDDNYAGALLSLRDASQTLEELNNALSAEHREIITAIQEDLTDIQDALKNDLETASSDLNRLTTNLIRFERAILE